MSVRQSITNLEALPGEAVDIDVGPGAEWVAVCKRRDDFVVVTSAGEFPAPPSVRFPLVRWMGFDQIVLVETRTVKERDNAFVFSLNGKERRRFCVGDGVQDVLVSGDKVVVTYFDEGVFGNVPPSSEGLCIFSATGELELGYQTDIKNPVDIADCYCACLAGRYEVCFSPYTGFPLVRLNIKSQNQDIYELPDKLAGSSALATDGRNFYFYGPYHDQHGLFHWRPGGAPERIGTHPGPLRGLGRGTFLAVELSGYTTITPGSTH